jgi:hypothetical protein
VKNQHAGAYQEWLGQINDFNNKDQKKISDLFVKNNEPTRTPSSKSFYKKDHPRQIQLSQSIVEYLIVDLGLPLSIVEREPFIKFMNTVDPKFTIISRRTLSRSTIPPLFTTMNDELKNFAINRNSYL